MRFVQAAAVLASSAAALLAGPFTNSSSSGLSTIEDLTTTITDVVTETDTTTRTVGTLTVYTTVYVTAGQLKKRAVEHTTTTTTTTTTQDAYDVVTSTIYVTVNPSDLTSATSTSAAGSEAGSSSTSATASGSAPLSSVSETGSPSGPHTTVVTITLCSAGKCTEVPETTGVTVVTSTHEGTVTEYTTYCPLTGHTSTATEDDETTTVVTITLCAGGVCTEKPETTGVTVVTETHEGTVTEYTTYCPLTGHTSTTTVDDETTTVVTVTLCYEDKCSKTKVTTGLTEVTSTLEGTVTVYTTYCPLTGTTPVTPSVPTTVLSGTVCIDDECVATTITTGVTVVSTISEGTVTEYTTYCPLTGGETPTATPPAGPGLLVPTTITSTVVHPTTVITTSACETCSEETVTTGVTYVPVTTGGEVLSVPVYTPESETTYLTTYVTVAVTSSAPTPVDLETAATPTTLATASTGVVVLLTLAVPAIQTGGAAGLAVPWLLAGAVLLL